MGKSPKGGGQNVKHGGGPINSFGEFANLVGGARAGGQAAPQQASYGGSVMPQAQAFEKYNTDMANWRAPTTTGAGYAGMEPVSMTPFTGTWGTGGDMGPPIPAMGVLPQAPVPVQRQALARVIQSQPYVGGRGGDRSSSGYSGSASGGRGGFGGSSARSGGLY